MSSKTNYEYRTGIGTDLHRLAPNRKLMLGGIEIPFPLGLLGHSDGDVVLHSVIDAILGAAGLGDIGMHFPDNDARFKDLDSKELLLIVKQMYEDKGWEVVNIDLTVHAEEPHLGRFKAQIKRSIASILGIDFNNVNTKAKTSEGLGTIGTGQAIATTAAVLLRRKIK